MFRKSSLGLKKLRIYWFWPVLCIYVLLGICTLLVSQSAPFLSIELEEKDGLWYVKDPYYKAWAEKNGLSVGDIVLQVDDIDINKLKHIKSDQSIREGNSLTIKKTDGSIMNIKVKHLDIPQQFFTLLVIPVLYFLLTFFVGLYLYHFKKHIQSLNILIVFMFTVSLAYISSGASSKLNSLGILINGSCMLLCLVIFIHFLKHYLNFLEIELKFPKNIEVLYVIPFIGFIFSIISLINPEFLSIRSFIILSLFFVLLAIILVLLVVSYLKYKTPQLKLLFLGIIVPFLPFMLLYVIPEILFNRQIFSADVSALFLLLLPFTFIFTQLTERIFDMEYFITRIRYYLSFSFFFTVWLVLGLYWLADDRLTIVKVVETFFFVFLSLIALFYIKEKVDYRQRKVLFSTKGDYIHQLYTTIDKIGKAYKIEALLEKFAHEVALHLELNCVYVLTYDYQHYKLITKNESSEFLHNQLDPNIIEKLQLGDIKKIDTYYLAFIHQDAHYKRILVLGHNNSIKLKDEELLWLELLLLYVNNFIDNTKMIEGLIEELKQMKQADGDQLPWLNKLLWLRFEEEKYQLAQELHDTNLQEQLHIAREVDALIHTKDPADIQLKLVKIHEQMVASMHDLRAYCENLKPPLLDTLGLNAALEKLLQKVISRADFLLIYTIDRLYLEDERLNLLIYRLFQELLNNALKHSDATSVEIHLIETMDGFEITYTDNGVGCDLDDLMLTNSMGIKGMQERVKAFNGKFQIQTSIHEGMSVQILIKEGSDTLDFGAYSG